MKTTDQLSNTFSWFQEAVPTPTDKNRSVQLGVHFEEVVECLESLTAETISGFEAIDAAIDTLKVVSEYLKGDIGGIKVDPQLQTQFLDSLTDQVVTAVGSAYVNGYDFMGAMTEVNASNWSKFVNGKAVFNEQGKIKKGSDYFPPDLSKYI